MTQRDYLAAMEEIEQALAESWKSGGEEELGSVRAHVAAKDKEIQSLKDLGQKLEDGWAEANEKHFAVVTEQKKRIAELEQQLEAEKRITTVVTDWEAQIAKNAELENLTRLQRDSIEGLRGAVKKLMERFQGAPKVGIAWRDSPRGERPVSVWLDGDGHQIAMNWRTQIVHAIPVDPDQTPDAAKMALELSEQAIKGVSE